MMPVIRLHEGRGTPLHLCTPGPGKPWLTQGGASDRDRIGSIVLAAAPAPPKADGGQVSRDIDRRLAARALAAYGLNIRDRSVGETQPGQAG
jgi:hypothetical protein